jgi:mono/diheme cytochrome c family protein
MPKTTNHAVLKAAFTGLAFVVYSTPGFSADARRGEQFALHVCAACHFVPKAKHPGDPSAPSFQTIAESRQFHEKGIRLLWEIHPKMPNLATTQDELDNLGAYLKTLAK